MRRRVRLTRLDRGVDRIRFLLMERPRFPSRRLGGVLALAGLLVLAIPASHRAAGYVAQSRALAEPAETPRDREARGGEFLGRIAIPSVAMDLAVFEGTSDSVLRKGPGHLPGSEWPGRTSSRGNCVIAGHRDSFFRKLRRVRSGDAVILTDRNGSSHVYELVGSRIVHPETVSVAAPTPDERLTLVSCYPFTWTGPAPYRIVWTARPVVPHGSGSRSRPGGGRIPERSAALR
jgi:LPXTG-site transpeptidase (sortase) family protein